MRPYINEFYKFSSIVILLVVVLLACDHKDSERSNSRENNVVDIDYKPFDWSTLGHKNTQLGNTAGNHANGGLLCEYNGWIYYNDYNNEGYLCKSLPDGTDKTMLIEEKCYNINVIDEQIFYQREEDNVIRKCDLDGKNVFTLVAEPIDDMIVTNECIYFVKEYIEKIDIYGNNRIKISPKGFYPYLDIYGDVLFYTSIKDEYVNLCAIKNDGSELYIAKEKAKGSVIIEENLFYTSTDDNTLKWYQIGINNTVEIGTGYNVNLWNNTIFYINNNYIRSYSDSKDSGYIFPEYNENDDNHYEILWYYIIGDRMFIIYEEHEEHEEHEDHSQIKQLISLNLVTNEIHKVP